MILPKNNLEDLYRYPLSEESRQDKLRLEMNENICPLSETELEEIRALLTPTFFNCYPEYHELYQELASNLHIKPSELLLVNGSDSASRLLFETFISAGERVVLTNPTFAMHRVYAQIAGAQVEEVTYEENFELDIDKLKAALTEETKLCILVNPNNPTGQLLSIDTLLSLATHCEKREILFMVDEAYIDFAGKSFCQHASRFTNAVVTRTFSKAYGLAALRIGYVASNQRLADLLRRTQPIFDVNNFAVLCARYVLRNPQILARHHDSLAKGLRFLTSALEELGYEIRSGAGNFLLIRSKGEPVEIQRMLSEKGILLSAGFSLPFLAPYIRISTGPEEAMREFLQAFLEAEANYKQIANGSG